MPPLSSIKQSVKRHLNVISGALLCHRCCVNLAICCCLEFGTAFKSGAKFYHKGGTEALLKLHLYRLFNAAQRWHECIYTTVVAVNRDEVGQSRSN